MAIDLAFVLSNLFFFFSLLFLAAESCVQSHEREDCKTAWKKKKKKERREVEITENAFVCVCVYLRVHTLAPEPPASWLFFLSFSFWTSQSLETKFQQTWTQPVSKRKLGNKLPF